jgi:LssY C-terminus
VTVKLTKSLEWDAPNFAKLPPITPAVALANLAESQPSRTTAASPPRPSDLTNLMFIGTQQQLLAAFHEAGWFAADRLNEVSKFETARAIIENRGYSEAPVSILILDGSPPDVAFQKQNNTFAKRHHIRIWLRPQTFHRKPVWVAAATHDIGIIFSPESRSFTHAIDSHIDDERTKIVNDLLFTGRVRAMALVHRTAIPKHATNATGDALITDGKMAVLEF